jgi:hypothetical protein
MIQFHEGQEVEVEICDVSASPNGGTWAHAKIVFNTSPSGTFDQGRRYCVQFPDNSRAVFDAEHIRTTSPFNDEGMGPYSEGMGP